MYSLWFRRYMDEFGATNEDFGRYTVVARRHAATNPNAWFYQRPITLDDHQQSRWIVEPVLRLLDCCQESDGGVALVVTSADRARDLPQPAVRIEAAADAHLGNGGVMYNYYHPDLAVFPEAEFLARQLWERSGLGPDDIDVAMLYENFSPIVFYQLEAFGFCKRGEAKDFIADGNIDLDGALPVNTNGGLLGEAYIHGLNNIAEGVRQVRGSAVNQVARVDHVLVAAGQSGLCSATRSRARVLTPSSSWPRPGRRLPLGSRRRARRRNRFRRRSRREVRAGSCTRGASMISRSVVYPEMIAWITAVAGSARIAPTPPSNRPPANTVPIASAGCTFIECLVTLGPRM